MANRRDREKAELLAQELTSLQQSVRAYTSYMRAVANPDQVLTNTDDGRRRGISLFDDMLREAHTQSVWQRRSIAVTGAEWEITCRDARHADTAAEIATVLRPRMHGVITDIMDSVAKGYSVQEIIWRTDKERIGIDRICSRDQRYFRFDISGGLLFTPSGSQSQLMPDQKFIVATFGGKSGNRYGQGILSAAFWPYYLKKNVCLFWADALERFGQPIPIGTYPGGTAESRVEEFLTALRAIQTDYSLVIPEGFSVELKEAIASGSLEGFEALARYFDQQISKAILSSVLTVDEGQNGTRAQATVHARGEEEILESDLKYVERVVNSTLVAWLWDLNYGETPPEVAFSFPRREQLPDQAEIEGLKALVGFGLPIPSAWLYKRFQIPPPQDGEDVIVGGATAGKAPPDNGGNFSAPEKGGDQQLKELEAIDKFFEQLFEATLPRLRKSALELCDKILKIGDWKGALEEMDNEQDTTEAALIWTELIEIAYLVGLASHKNASGEFAEKTGGIDWEKIPIYSPAALKYLRRIIPVTQAEWKKLDASSKRWAYSTAETANIDITNAFKNEMLETIQGGEGYAGYMRRINDLREYLATNKLVDQTGSEKTFDKQHKQKYYQTMYTAHGFARRQALQDDPSAIWWKYVTVGDSRVRPRHAMLDGFIAKRDDPIWKNLFPPIGYNCRCRVISCEAPEKASTIPDEWKPDKGFETGMSNQTYTGLVNKIIDIMKNDESTHYYRNYLTETIKTWVDRRLQPFHLYQQSKRLPAPAILANITRKTEWLRKEMGGRLQNLNMNAGVADAIEKIQIRLPRNVRHLLKLKQRLYYLDYMKATLENPLEIWEAKRVDPNNPGRPAQTNYAFLALFDDGTGHIVIVRNDGELCTQYNVDAQQIDKARRGKLVYEKQ